MTPAEREKTIRAGLKSNCGASWSVSDTTVRTILGDFTNCPPKSQMATMAMAAVRKFIKVDGAKIVQQLKGSNTCRDIYEEWRNMMKYFRLVYTHGRARGCNADRKERPQPMWVFRVTVAHAADKGRFGFDSMPIVAATRKDAAEILSRTYKPERFNLKFLRKIERDNTPDGVNAPAYKAMMKDAKARK